MAETDPNPALKRYTLPEGTKIVPDVLPEPLQVKEHVPNFLELMWNGWQDPPKISKLKAARTRRKKTNKQSAASRKKNWR